MHIPLAKSISLTAMLLVVGVLSACGNVSHKVAADGNSAGQLIWPTPDSVTPMHKGGTFPTLDSVRLLGPGMDKQQIMSLIGAPHFSEGVWGVREWNYVFNFRKPGSDQVTVCQYKILFDDHKLARSFYWKPESCADLLKPPAEIAAQKEQKFTLSSDALFAFDKSAVGDITPNGREQLDTLAKKIVAAGDKVGGVHIIGYTDQLGSDSYNASLSERRAYSVMQYLVQQGVHSDAIVAEGRGKIAPVKTDCTDTDRNALIACLAPNRRVEVTVEGSM